MKLEVFTVQATGIAASICASKLRAIWRIYIQSIQKKHACKILHKKLHTA